MNKSMRLQDTVFFAFCFSSVLLFRIQGARPSRAVQVAAPVAPGPHGQHRHQRRAQQNG